MRFSTSFTMHLFYDLHPPQTIHFYELLIQDNKRSRSLVSLEHQVLQQLSLSLISKENLLKIGEPPLRDTIGVHKGKELKKKNNN